MGVATLTLTPLTYWIFWKRHLRVRVDDHLAYH